MIFKQRTERGQAIILIVFGIIALVALTALAVDADTSPSTACAPCSGWARARARSS